MKTKLFKTSIFLGLLLLLVSCDKTYKMPSEVSVITAAVKVERFDQEFNNVDSLKLKELKETYPFLFSSELKDTFWLKKSKDTLQQELVTEVAKVFPVNNQLEEELVIMYKYLKYYYPQIEVPRVIGLISEVDYRNRVILTKELLLLSLDCYLGSEHHFYMDIDKYIREDFVNSSLVPDVAMEYAKKIIARPDGRDFMSQMIMFGKRRYLLSKLLPTTPLNVILGYTAEELNWIDANESFVWRYFMEKNMLYSTDKNLLPRFMYPGPFSKFYLDIDSQSVDRVGQYIGFQIVLAFMEHNKVSLPQVMEMDSKVLFESSKYKPKK